MDPLVVADLRPIEGAGDLAAEWADLQERAEPSPCLAWPWVATWLDHLPGSMRPLVFRARDVDGLLALGLLVVQPGEGSARLLGPTLHLQETGDPDLDGIAIEYGGLLAREGAEAVAYRALFDVLAADGRRWRRLRISGCTAAAAVLGALPSGLGAFDLGTQPAFVVDLAALRASGAEYVTTLGPRTRAGLRRTRRAYEAVGEPVLEVAPDVATALAWFGELRRLHERHWAARGEGGAFAHAGFEPFHRELIRRGTAAGYTRLSRVRAGDLVVAYLYDLVWRGRAYFYNGGLAYGALQPGDRPGYLAQWLSIERHLADGLAAYEFMAGDQEYKRTLGASPRPMQWLEIRPLRRRLGAERALARIARRPTVGTPIPGADPAPIS